MEQYTKLTTKLKELFELEKSDLDFGIHRIIKARHSQIAAFLSDTPEPNNPNLKHIVQRELGDIDKSDLETRLTSVTSQIKDEFGNRAFDGDTLVHEEALQYGLGLEWKELTEKMHTSEEELNTQLEAEIYSHLYEFFSRYYDEADFLSKRRIKAGDAPYAVPYSGEEVMLHWANKDQYYIKTSEDMKDYTFTITDKHGKHYRVKFQCERQDSVLNNNKAKREFHLDANKEISHTENTLTLPFHYKIVEKARTTADKSEFISEILTSLSTEWKKLLKETPTGGTKPHLEKHFTNYSKKNKSDFFIHKHLAKFLRGELDFYIKNEVMHLDEVDDKGVDYLTRQIRKIKAIRAIALEIITFLAQMENFQKKLWLKKKYVTETHYGITIDHILAHKDADTLLKTIADSRAQRSEWNSLYALEDILPATEPLTPDFLRENDKLMVDTKFFDQSFKYQLLSHFDDLDEVTNGVLINSENFQALNLLQERYKEKVKCIYIDPPYNTGGDDFVYKDSFRNSSWIAMLQDRLLLSKNLLNEGGANFCSIDDKDEDNRVSHRLMNLMEEIYGPKNYLDNLIWIKNTTHNDSKTFSHNHEYILAYCKNREIAAKQHTLFRVAKPGFTEVQELVAEMNPSYPSIENFRDKLKKLYRAQTDQYKAECLAQGLEWNDEIKKANPWKGVKQYKYAEYRDESFKLVSENQASLCNARICVFRESDPSWPNSNTLKDDTHRNSNSDEFRFYRPNHPITGNLCPAPGRGWLWRQHKNLNKPDVDSYEDKVAEDLIHFGTTENKVPQVKRFLSTVSTDVVKSTIADFTDGEKEVAHLFGARGTFPNPKPTTVLAKLTSISTFEGDVILDYFVGSGSTIQAVINQNRIDGINRKYVAVEQGGYFINAVVPRTKKATYSAKWKDGKPESRDTGVSQIIKYFSLEQYEDTLNNLELSDKRADLLGYGEEVQEDYLFRYQLDIETREHLLNLDRFTDPWGCLLKIYNPNTGNAEPKNIDLIETFNYLLGVTVAEWKLRDGFLTIEGTNPEGKTVLIIWRKTADAATSPSDWQVTDNDQLHTFIQQTRKINLADTEYDSIYINGDHTLHDPTNKIFLTEEVFYEEMFKNTGNPED